MNLFWETPIPQTGIDKIVDANKDVERFIAYGMGKDERLLELIDECVKRNKIVVYLMPSTEYYPPVVRRAIELGKSNLHLYEVEMGMTSVLKARAQKYMDSWSGIKTHLIGEI